MGERLTLPCPKIVPVQQQLTSEQWAYAHTFGDARVAALLSPSPVDEQEAEEHLRDAYRIVQLVPPTTIRWFDSPRSFVEEGLRPRAGGTVASLVRLAGGNVENQLMSVGKPGYVFGGKWVLASINDHLEHSVWASVRNAFWDGPRSGLCEYVGQSVCTRVGQSVRKDMWVGSESDGAWGIMRASTTAYFTAGRLAFHWFFHEVFEENTLIHIARFNELVSGYWLGKEEAWLVRKPVILQLDQLGGRLDNGRLHNGRLHNASGPCVRYRDGWGWYAWHGIDVSEKLIMHPERVTKEEWVSELNVEVRRAIQERLGTERFIELVGGKTLDRGKRGNLIEIDLRGDRERIAHYVQVQDSSTERHYYLRVPPAITSADEAIAWTFGLNARDYQPGQET